MVTPNPPRQNLFFIYNNNNIKKETKTVSESLGLRPFPISCLTACY